MSKSRIPIAADLHTHTVASIHAFNTLEEMARAAAARNLWGLGITEHGPGVTFGTTEYFFFYNTEIWPEEMHGVRLFRGCEANILNTSGTLDILDSSLSRLDFVLAGLHAGPYIHWRDAIPSWTTKSILRAMDNPYVDCISHPCNPRYPMDYEAFVKKAAARDILIEVNISSLCNTMRTGSRENLREILSLAIRYDAEIVVNSDAHIAQSIGNMDAGLDLLEEIGVPAEQIVNSTPAQLLAFLRKKKKKRFLQF